jgi:1-acyl-sn-glycerol-3-phosphate acyltransferase
VATLCARAIVAFARIITGVQSHWIGCSADPHCRIYYANHASHGDFILVWSVMRPQLRQFIRPVAGADYWRRNRLRTFISNHVFNAVLIERTMSAGSENPVGQMIDALDAGASLIFFPEGTRNTTGEILLPLKRGLFHLATARPDVEIVPTWIDNLNRVLPKGEFLPVPLLCTVTFGAPLEPVPGEECAPFLARARAALLHLAPQEPCTQ